MGKCNSNSRNEGPISAEVEMGAARVADWSEVWVVLVTVEVEERRYDMRQRREQSEW